jgi:penicillin-binding protein 2
MKKIPLLKKGASAINFSSNERPSQRLFLTIYLFIIGLVFAILAVRLFVLTVVMGDYYRRLADGNRIKEIVIEASRGAIFDRKKNLIVENLKPDYQQKNERIDSLRIYYQPEAIAHLVGYRRVVDENDLKNNLCLTKLQQGDRVGKKGIEKKFDCDLRGVNGQKLVETDAYRKEKKTFSVIEPKKGKDLTLSIDLSLQEKAYQLIKEKKGVVVALIPKTGEVLVLAASPSFNPQEFEAENSDAIGRYLNDPNRPLFNRATEGVYPPGSIFKLIVSTAALEEKVIDEETQFEDKGKVKIGNLEFGNWYFLQYGKTDGMVDVTKAILRSNDIFFYLVGEKLGVEKIKKWAEIFGLGEKTGIGIEELEGIVPFPFWKEEKLGEKWYLGDTINLSIGQGYLLTTPLQMARATAVFANGGYLCQPQLLKSQNSNLSDVAVGVRPKASDKSQNCKKLPISTKTLDLVREGMKQTCEPGGTGWPLFNFKVKNEKLKIEKEIKTGCKTGTAESPSTSGKPHAWFTIFAPFDEPQIVITVLIEEGGQGSDVAAPIAKEILTQYFLENGF